jgi:hypothetical protein
MAVNVFAVFLFSLVKMTIKSKKVRQAEITFGKVISAEKTSRLFYFSTFSGYVYKEK